jgi:DNA polymerase-3 subunit delta
MKATQRDFASVAPRAVKQAHVFFLCGTDDASVQDAAHRIAGLLPDPGERVEFSGAELKRDPVRLGDEARSTSLFGDARHIWVRCSGDEAHDAVEILIGGDVPPCPVIIQAANASDNRARPSCWRSATTRWWRCSIRPTCLGEHERAHAGRCRGVTIDGELAQRIAQAVRLDTRLAASEIAKMALFLDAAPEAPKRASAEVFARIGASSEEDGFTTLVNSVLAGDAAAVPAELRRMGDKGLNAVGLLLAFERRVAQLVQLAARLGNRRDVRALLDEEKNARRVMWKDVPDLAVQLQKWRGDDLEKLARRMANCTARCLATANRPNCCWHRRWRRSPIRRPGGANSALRGDSHTDGIFWTKSDPVFCAAYRLISLAIS